MAKSLTPEQLIEQFEKLTTEEQLSIKEKVDKILADKKKEAQAQLEKLKGIEG